MTDYNDELFDEETGEIFTEEMIQFIKNEYEIAEDLSLIHI